MIDLQDYTRTELVTIILRQRTIYADVIERVAKLLENTPYKEMSNAVRNMGLFAGLETVRLFNEEKVLKLVQIEQIQKEPIKQIPNCRSLNKNHSFRGAKFCMVCGAANQASRVDTELKVVGG